METTLLVALIEGWLLFNLLLSLIFITCTGEVISLEELPHLFIGMLFNIVPVFIIVQLRKRRKEKKSKERRMKARVTSSNS